MKKKIVLLLLFILFSGPAFPGHMACADPSGDTSIIKEGGLYKLISRDIPLSGGDRSVIPYSTSGGAINPHLHAGLEILTASGPVFKTYYAPGEEVALWAMWGPPFIWGNSIIGKEFTVTVTLKDGATLAKLNSSTFTDTITDKNPYVSGIGHGFTIPASAQNGDTFILTVEMTIPGVTLAGPKKTKTLYVTTQKIDDLSLPAFHDFSQRSWLWAGEQLGTCPDTTIGGYGSATISKAFLFIYFGHYTSPVDLNACLTYAGGYLAGPNGGKCQIPKNQTNQLIPDPAVHGHFRNEVCAPGDTYWDGFFSTGLESRIDNYLAAGIPVIAKTTVGPEAKEHFVVVVGKRGNKWDIFDPLDGHYHMKETRPLSPLLGIWLFSQQ